MFLNYARAWSVQRDDQMKSKRDQQTFCFCLKAYQCWIAVNVIALNTWRGYRTSITDHMNRSPLLAQRNCMRVSFGTQLSRFPLSWFSFNPRISKMLICYSIPRYLILSMRTNAQQTRRVNKQPNTNSRKWCPCVTSRNTLSSYCTLALIPVL